MLDICIRCSSKDCEKSKVDTFDFCRYGVAFYNTGTKIKKKEETVTLRHISHNLKHELNKVLQTIISEASLIDPTVSTKRIELNKPASKIVAATVIIDQFIEMISGVNEFHPSLQHSSNLDKKSSLLNMLDKYSKVYSLILNTRRAKDINFNFNIDSNFQIAFAYKIIEYIIATLIDNIWKYSNNNSIASITATKTNGVDINLNFSNSSKPINNPQFIFKKGFQCEAKSEGFGYGLYWAKILIDHYNTLSKRTSEILELTHKQEIIDKDNAIQFFTLKNIRA